MNRQMMEAYFIYVLNIRMEFVISCDSIVSVLSIRDWTRMLQEQFNSCFFVLLTPTEQYRR